MNDILFVIKSIFTFQYLRELNFVAWLIWIILIYGFILALIIISVKHILQDGEPKN